MQVFESEGDLLTLGNASYREVEPGFVVVALHVGRRVLLDPQVNLILAAWAATGPRQIARAEVTAHYNFCVGDLVDWALGEV